MKLITFLFYALTVIGLGQAFLQCYSCYSLGCSDPFNATATGVKNMTCVSGYNKCGKQAVTADSLKMIYRGCVNDTLSTRMSIENVQNRADIKYGKLYTCNTNFCNGGNSIKNPIAVAFASLVGLAYITL